jgi:hypothetical protein
MLLGYNEEGIIEFIFTDDSYLSKKFPNNSAKITDFWGAQGGRLKELFIDVPSDFNYKEWKVVDGKLIKLESPVKENQSIKTIVEEKSSGPVNVEIKSESNPVNNKINGSYVNRYGGPK